MILMLNLFVYYNTSNFILQVNRSQIFKSLKIALFNKNYLVQGQRFMLSSDVSDKK